MLTRRLFPALVATLLPVGGTRAQTHTSLQLVLAVDASGSVNMPRFILQKDGYAAAFRHPGVKSAIRNSATGSIAVMMLQWTGPAMQETAVDWTLLDSDGATDQFAHRNDQSQRRLFVGGTSISGAIDAAARQFPRCPFPAEKRTIDVFGDGSNNRGRPSALARDDAVGQGIVINGLPILAVEPWSDTHYRDHVIGGPGAFLIAAASFEEFAQAIRRKLITEIAAATPDPPISPT